MAKKKKTTKKDTKKKEKSQRVLRSSKKKEVDSNLSDSNEDDSYDSKREETKDEGVELEVDDNTSNISENNNNNNNIPIATMATFDSKLEALITVTLRYPLGSPQAMSLERDGLTSFEDFILYQTEDFLDLKYVDPSDGTKLIALSKPLCRILQNCRFYCIYLESIKDAHALDPTDTSTSVWEPAVMRAWIRNDLPAFLAGSTTAIPANTGISTSNFGPGIVSQEKKDADALTGFNRKPLDKEKYPKLKNDADYHKWNLDFTRQAKADEIDRVLVDNYDLKISTRVGDDRKLAEKQLNFLSIVLSHSLLTTKGKALCNLHETRPLSVWRDHTEHQTISDAARDKAAKLSVDLYSLKMSDHPSRSEFLTAFAKIVIEHDEIAAEPVTEFNKLTYLRSAISQDEKLASTWITLEDTHRINKAPPPTYHLFFKRVDQLAGVLDLAESRKRAPRHAMMGNIQSDDVEDDAISNVDDETLQIFIAKMSERGTDITNEHLDTIRAFQSARNYSKDRQQRPNRPPRNPEADIPASIFLKTQREFKIAWMKEPENIKIAILQCKAGPKPGKKNSDLAVYSTQTFYNFQTGESEELDSDAYDTDRSAYQSESSYAAEFDADDVDSDGEVDGSLNLNVNAARSGRARGSPRVAQKPGKSILKSKRRLVRKSELPSGHPSRMLANDMIPVTDRETGDIIGAITYHRKFGPKKANRNGNINVTMARYQHRFDEIPIPISPPECNYYYVSESTFKMIYALLALMDGGANGGIAGRDMKLMYYHPDARRVNIGIAGGHQLTGKRIGTFCAVVMTQMGLVLGIYHQYAHVPEQEHSIHSRCQFQSYGNLVCDTAVQFGGQQRIFTSDGYHIPLNIRSGLPYVQQTFPTAQQLKDLPHVVFTSADPWNPEKIDDMRSPTEMLRQIPIAPQDAINEFYDCKGVINANKVVTKPDGTTGSDRVGVDEERSLDVDGGEEKFDVIAPPSTNPADSDDAKIDNFAPPSTNPIDSDDAKIDNFAPPSTIPIDDTGTASKLIWNDPIDDANGEKFVSARLRKSRRKRMNRRRAVAKKKLKAQQELEQHNDNDLLPALQVRNDADSSDDDDSDPDLNLLPALRVRDNEDSSDDDDSDDEPERVSSINDNGRLEPKSEPSRDIDITPSSVPDGVPSLDTKVDPDFYPTSNLDVDFVDFNPDSTGTIVEQSGVIYLERQLGDDVYYQPLDMYDNPNKTIDFISKGSQYWTLCNDAPALNKQSNVIVDTEFDSTYLNNLDIPRPTEHEFFDEWLLDDPSIRIMMQGCLDDCAEYNVSAHDLSQVLNPLTPRMSTPTAIDYESKRKYFAHLPAVNVKATLKYTTQNMRLPPSTYLLRRTISIVI